MLTRKLLSVIDNIVVDVFKTICCSEPTDSFMVNVTVAQLLGHKFLQPGHVPRLPPAPLGAATAHWTVDTPHLQDCLLKNERQTRHLEKSIHCDVE